VEFYLLSVILGKALGEVNNHGKVQNNTGDR
jgi:hypothetical protein